MVEQAQARAAGCDLIFQPERPRRRVRVHDEHEDKQAGFASMNLRRLLLAGLGRRRHPESGRFSCKGNASTRQYAIEKCSSAMELCLHFAPPLMFTRWENEPSHGA